MTTANPRLDEHVFLLLGQTYALARKHVEVQCSLHGIGIAEYSLLRIVENTPSITAGEARKRLYSSAPSVAQLVKSLEKKKLISRRQDAKDVRRQKIVLTTKGNTVITAAREAIQAMLRASKIPAGVLQSLQTNLTALSTSLSSYGD